MLLDWALSARVRLPKSDVSCEENYKPGGMKSVSSSIDTVTPHVDESRAVPWHSRLAVQTATRSWCSQEAKGCLTATEALRGVALRAPTWRSGGRVELGPRGARGAAGRPGPRSIKSRWGHQRAQSLRHEAARLRFDVSRSALTGAARKPRFVRAVYGPLRPPGSEDGFMLRTRWRQNTGLPLHVVLDSIGLGSREGRRSRCSTSSGHRPGRSEYGCEDVRPRHARRSRRSERNPGYRWPSIHRRCLCWFS